MTFNLCTSGRFYTPEQAKKLEALGFAFTVDDERLARGSPDYMYKTWEPEEADHKPPTVEINTLDELLEFTRKWGGGIVLDTGRNQIEIYDDYRE